MYLNADNKVNLPEAKIPRTYSLKVNIGSQKIGRCWLSNLSKWVNKQPQVAAVSRL